MINPDHSSGGDSPSHGRRPRRPGSWSFLAAGLVAIISWHKLVEIGKGLEWVDEFLGLHAISCISWLKDHPTTPSACGVWAALAALFSYPLWVPVVLIILIRVRFRCN